MGMQTLRVVRSRVFATQLPGGQQRVCQTGTKVANVVRLQVPPEISLVFHCHTPFCRTTHTERYRDIVHVCCHDKHLPVSAGRGAVCSGAGKHGCRTCR